MPTPSKEVSKLRSNREPSVIISLSVSQPNWTRLVKMRKAKGSRYEQELIRVFISEGLDKAGF